ncbi:holo-ACP synthase [Pedobacter alpinus]|uniref:Holo-ACP synthase n=1 Tax=Pedobacter alpinus TaxID=1590643 RepID=A0ABW5TR29_9SPHI
MIKEIANQQDFAIGNDVVFLSNFMASYNPLFQKKVYTQKEIDYCEQFEENLLHYASTWAAKEAVYKAIKQLNPKPISFKKIEILRSKIGGIPSPVLPELYQNLNISLSISHDGDYVWAAAIVKK